MAERRDIQQVSPDIGAAVGDASGTYQTEGIQFD
jgi:hypothetical protein